MVLPLVAGLLISGSLYSVYNWYTTPAQTSDWLSELPPPSQERTALFSELRSVMAERRGKLEPVDS